MVKDACNLGDFASRFEAQSLGAISPIVESSEDLNSVKFKYGKVKVQKI